MTAIIIYLLLVFNAFLLGVFNYSRLSETGRLLTVLLGFVFILELINTFPHMKITKTNYPSMHIVTYVQMIMYSLIYSKLLTNLKAKITVSVLGLLFLNLSLIHGLKLKLDTFPSINISFLSILVVVGVLLHFYEIIKRQDVRSILRDSKFLFSAVNLIFFGVTFFIYTMLRYLLYSGEIDDQVWTYAVIKIANYILYSGYILSLYFELKNTQQNIS